MSEELFAEIDKTLSESVLAPFVSGADALSRVVRTLNKYVRFPDRYAVVAVALWIAATHAVPAWNAAPRLVLNSPQKRCGKSRALDLIEGLSHDPCAAIDPTAAALFRLIERKGDNPPTLLIDEADAIFKTRSTPKSEQLRGLINAGHQRNRKVYRVDGAYPTFAMIALAGIGTLPDTVTDRAINITMRRRKSDEPVSHFRVARDRPDLDALREVLAIWTSGIMDNLRGAAPMTGR